MNREWAINLVKQHMKKPNLIKHVIAVGGCMKRLANYFNENEERWEIAGILHDLEILKIILKWV
jgi:predicted hydrolase (HD superfamily)